MRQTRQGGLNVVGLSCKRPLEEAAAGIRRRRRRRRRSRRRRRRRTRRRRRRRRRSLRRRRRGHGGGRRNRRGGRGGSAKRETSPAVAAGVSGQQPQRGGMGLRVELGRPVVGLKKARGFETVERASKRN